jgi:predicted transglutaminase-like cysteine proteinase
MFGVDADRTAAWLSVTLGAVILALSLKTAVFKSDPRIAPAMARAAFDSEQNSIPAVTGRTWFARLNPPSPAPDSVRLAALDFTATLPSMPLRTGPSSVDEPFGLLSFPAADGDLWRKWQAVETLIDAEMKLLERCRSDSEDCSIAARRFLDIVEAALPRNGRARIGAINRAINLSIRPVSDRVQFGVTDNWTSPLTTLSTNRGDCEDYALAKYLALRETGVAEDDLRLVIVRDTMAKEDHAVLATRVEARWLILDNRNHMLVDATETRHFRPLFALDREGVRRFAPVLANASEANPARSDALTYLSPSGDKAAGDPR